mmetsp:Transcript_3589/g.5879  ORF Transcript_3589/g.5879 Transcript_3589/m.5879 type:complete len:518 (+) Transcript_3589:218-1771(+)
MHIPGSHLRRTAALSLIATVLPSSAFIGGNIISPACAASTGSGIPSTSFGVRSNSFARPLFVRGGQSSINDSTIVRNMSTSRKAPATESFDSSPFNRPITKVAVVGGTHGNEYTGVWCIKAIEHQRQQLNKNNKSKSSAAVNVFEQFPTLDIQTLLANPRAYMENKRFVDTDLNREFSKEKLRKVVIDETVMEECDIRNEFCSEDDDGINSNGGSNGALTYEAVRAREIESLLGPKFTEDTEGDASSSSSCENPATDVVIDLHTTTTNMGISIIIPEGDPLMAAAAAYVMQKCRERYGEDGVQCCMHALPKREDRLNLSSCGRHGFTIEVGPTPQGVIRHDVVEKTEAAMHALLDFLHLRNLELQNSDNANASPSVLDQLEQTYPSGIVPCYRSAPAVRPGELSGKISWPNDPANPNFPALMVHGSVQDRDFEPLRVGDPLFVTLDGTVVPYDGSHGEEVHLIFVNEGGYYYESSGTGIGVAVKSRFDWQTGWFLVESDDEGGAIEEVILEEKDSYE